MEAGAPGRAPVLDPPIPWPVPPPAFRFRPTGKGDEVQFAVGVLTALAGAFVLFALPVNMYLLRIGVHWSAGGLLICIAGVYVVFSAVVFWSAHSAFRFSLRTGWGLIGEGLASLGLSLLFLGGILALVAGVLLLVAGGLTFAS